MLNTIIIGILLLLSGCASYPLTYTGVSPSESIIEKNYTLNNVSHVHVGDALISRLTVSGNDLMTTVLVKTYSPDQDFSLSFPNGTVSFYKGREYYSSYNANGLNLITVNITPHDDKNLSFVVYLPINNNGEVVGEYLLYSKASPYESSFSNKIRIVSEHINFNFKRLSRLPKFNYIGEKLKARTDDPIRYFRQELVYSGKFNNIIKILYREYDSLIIKGWFTHELSYDVDAGNTIRYKEFKIDVLSSSNEGISYKVIDD